MKKSCILILLIFQSLFLFSQNFQIGLNIGVATYHGDVASEKIWKAQDFTEALNIFVKKSISSEFSLRANFIFTKLRGKDSNHLDEADWRARRDYSFTTPIQEFSILGEWKYCNSDNSDPFFQPYLFAGTGILFSQANNIDSRVDFSIPFGGGFYLNLQDKISVGLEISSRKLFTDLIDGISDKEFSKANDWFFNIGLSLIYDLEGKN